MTIFRSEAGAPWRFFHVSSTIEKISGYSAADFIGGRLHWGELIVEPDLPHVIETIATALANGDCYEIDYRIVQRDGSLRWLRESGQGEGYSSEGIATVIDGVIFDVDSHVVKSDVLLSSNQMLSAQIESEQRKRRESELNYRAIFENSPEGILLLDRFGQIIRCNHAAAALLGYHCEELIGLIIADISPTVQPEYGVESDLLSSFLIEEVFSGQPRRFEWIYLQKSGEEQLLEVTLAAPSEDSDQLILLWRDQSEIRRLQMDRDLHQALLIQQSKQAELGNMIGAIAHQWKQPLNSIALIAQEIPELLTDSHIAIEERYSEVERLTATILAQADFLSETIDDFRNFYKPSVQRQIFNPLQQSRKVVELMRHQLRMHEITIELFGQESLSVYGSAGEFNQVILSLINNARDSLIEKSSATPQAVIQIEVNSRREESQALITISDNGPGIALHLLPDKLFEPFVSTKGSSGSGIGLALGRLIIEEKMGGRLMACNRDDCACFEISLPLASDQDIQ